MGARSGAKSWTVALALALALQSARNIQVVIVPCGSGAQAKQISYYFNEFYPVKLRDKRHWSATEMHDKRGNVVWVVNPSPNGIRSHRGRLIIFEEAEQMSQEVYEAATGQVMKGSRRLFLGTAENALWDTIYHRCECQVKITWEMMVKAGIGDMNEFARLKAELGPIAFKKMYEAEWVYTRNVFRLPEIHGIKGTWSFIGMDVNVYPGMAWVEIAFDGEKYVAVNEGCLENVQDVKQFTSPRSELWIETNSLDQVPGLQEWIADMAGIPVHYHLWTEGSKKENIGDAKMALDQGMLAIDEEKCPTLKRALNEQLFDDNGKMVKGELTHWVDAWLHAVHGAGNTNNSFNRWRNDNQSK